MKISNAVSVPDSEIELNAVRSQGPGGQNVNKVATAIHLRFDIQASSLPESYKVKLLRLKDHRIIGDGIIVIKAQKYRTQEKNRDDALDRLRSLIKKAMIVPKKRIPSKPSKNSQKKRLENKTRRSQIKKLRNKENLQD